MKKITTIVVLALLACSVSVQAQSKKGNPPKKDNGYSFVIKPQFNKVWHNFSEGIACVELDGEQELCFVDVNGKPISKQRYKNAYGFSCGRALVQKDEKWGFIDRKGKEVIPFDYVNARPFSEGYAVVAVNRIGTMDYYGYIDTLGKSFGRPTFDWAVSFNDNKAPVKSKGEWRILSNDLSGVIEDLPYDNIEEFHDGLARVQKDGQYGFINTKGELVIPTQFAEGEVGTYFSEELCPVKIDGKWGYMDLNGEIVIPCKYTYARAFSCKRAVVSEEEPSEWSGTVSEGFGAIDREGNYVVEPKFSFLMSFSEGYAVVAVDGKYGFINMEGEEVIPMEFEEAKSFSDGLAAVKMDGKWGFIKMNK